MSEIDRPKRYLTEIEVMLLKNQAMILAGLGGLLALQATEESRKLAGLMSQFSDETRSLLETAVG